MHGHATDKGLIVFIVMKVLRIKYGINDVFEEPRIKNVKVIHTKLFYGLYLPMFLYLFM